MIVKSVAITLALVVFWLVTMSRSWIMICVGILVAFALAYGIGVDSAQNEIESSRPLNVIRIGDKGATQFTEMRVRVLRTGERGVLYFDPADRSFGLLPWEFVRGMDWSISAIIGR